MVLQVARGLEGHVAERAVLRGDAVLPQVAVQIRLVARLVDAEAAAVLLGQQLGVELGLVVGDGVGCILRDLPPAVTSAPERARGQEDDVLLHGVHDHFRAAALLRQEVDRM